MKKLEFGRYKREDLDSMPEGSRMMDRKGRAWIAYNFENALRERYWNTAGGIIAGRYSSARLSYLTLRPAGSGLLPGLEDE